MTDLYKIFPRELQQLAELYAFGAEKHTPEGWQKQSVSHHLAHARAHLDKRWQGQKRDEETGMPQLTHVALRILFALWVENWKAR